MAFATLNTRYRNEGAAMYTLIRSLGSAVGISVLQTVNVRNTAIVHARLTEAIRPDNPVLALRLPGFDFQLPAAVAALDAEITRQAGMVGYLDGYWMLFVLTICISTLILLLKPARRRAKLEPVALHME
jgi:DHA2 family multidrug resistance protein